MSFGSELSNEFSILTKGISKGEVTLTNKLKEAFLELEKQGKYNGAVDIIHGAKSFVKFNHNADYVDNPASGNTVMRELSDMLFIVFSTCKTPEIRLMYLQNKVGKNEDQFMADLLQLHLLKEGKEIISNPLPVCAFGNSKILSDAVLPSIGSYGIFYKMDEGNATRMEMAYYPAANVVPQNTNGGKYRTACYDYTRSEFETTCIKKGYIENQGERTLEKFANALVRMEIGSPMLKDPAIHSLVQFLNCHSLVFRKYRDHFDIQTTHRNVSTDKMPFTCVINADLIAQIDVH